MDLEEVIKDLQKRFGKGAILKMDQNPEPIESIPTGSFVLDDAIGVGGYPKGRITEIYGAESGGKTTLALHAIAEAQQKSEKAAFIDAEHSLDLHYARNIGVKVEELLMSQPSCGEEALDITESLIRSGEIGILVVDSVAALTPRAEIEGEMGQSHMGLQARAMSQAMRKLTSIVSKTNCVLIFINQIRMKIGVIYGNSETTTGGNALKFYASVRLDIRKTKQIKEGNNIIGNEVKIKVVKNKVAPPFKVAETDIIYGVGIDKAGELLKLLVKFGIVKDAGSGWYKYKDSQVHGQQKMKDFVNKNWDELYGALSTIEENIQA